MTTRRHVIVTGGAGFIGSHLVKALLDDGYSVTVLDNFGSGNPDNLAGLDNRCLKTVRHDVRNQLPEFDNVDSIYHFASRASPSDFASHPVEIASTNSEGTRNVLEVARKHDAITLLASSSEVYGDPEIHPQKEAYNGNVNIRGPRASYDEGKRFAEALCFAYNRQYDLDIRTVRIFNTYGPRMRFDDGRAIPTFLSQALRGEDLTVYGDGTQTRSFCYVDDLVRGIRAFAEASANDVAGEVVNLGSTSEIEIRELAKVVIEILDTDSGIRFEERPPDDPSRRRPDVTRAESLLDWKAQVPLEEGLRKTVEAFRT